MITPVIIQSSHWIASLVFVCRNPAFVPLVCVCYPETANLTLVEIDFPFTIPDKDAVKLPREMHRERKRGTRQQSSVQTSTMLAARPTATVAVSCSGQREASEGGGYEQCEKGRGRNGFVSLFYSRSGALTRPLWTNVI